MSKQRAQIRGRRVHSIPIPRNSNSQGNKYDVDA